MAAGGGNELVALLKPPPLKLSKIGDPEQTLLDWKEYVKTFKRFMEVTKIDGDHTEEHVDCVGCKTAKNIILMVGQKELETLWDHVGNVNDGDSFEEALRKIEVGITGQTNQAISRHKLFTRMGQGEKDFAVWYPLIKEQALRCNFTDYNAETAARDAILFQTSNKKLQRDILSKDLDFQATIKAGLALEQSKAKQESLVDRKLEDDVRAVSLKKKNKKTTRVDCETCTNPIHAEGSCPAKGAECFGCGKRGHYSGSKACKKKKGSDDEIKKKKKEKAAKSRKLKDSDEDEDTDSGETTGRIKVRSVKSNPDEVVSLVVKALDHGVESKKAKMELVVDTGVGRTLISEKAWLKLKPHKGERDPLLKRNDRKFVPFGTDGKLECIGRSKATLEATAGAKVTTIVYIIRGVSENLLGKSDAVKLGIVEFRPDGAAEKVRMLSETLKKTIPMADEIVSAGMSQAEIDDKMEMIANEHKDLFEGFGRITGVDPIHIEVDESIKPVQQKRRPIPLKYVERFEDLLDDLKSKGVVSGPLDHKSATGWIHNPVIAEKKYNNKIRLTLDTRPMAKAVRTAKFPIPTPT